MKGTTLNSDAECGGAYGKLMHDRRVAPVRIALLRGDGSSGCRVSLERSSSPPLRVIPPTPTALNCSSSGNLVSAGVNFSMCQVVPRRTEGRICEERLRGAACMRLESCSEIRAICSSSFQILVGLNIHVFTGYCLSRRISLTSSEDTS